MPKWSTRDLLLAGSIAVNLVLAGFVVGAGARLAGPGAPPSSPPAFDGGISPRALVGSLSEDERRAVREAFMSEGQRSAPLFRELRDARAEFEAVVLAEPFDIEQARAALGRIQDAEHALEARGGDLMIEILAGLSPDERARALAEMRERGRRFRGPRGPGGRGDGSRPGAAENGTP